MTFKKGSKVDRGYTTVTEDEGVNYREIAETMSDLGFQMNHSSVRNYVLRVMRKFVVAFSDQWQIDLSESRIDEIAKSPAFQQAVADVLQKIEIKRRENNRTAL